MRPPLRAAVRSALRKVALGVLVGALLALPSAGCSKEAAPDAAFGAKVRAYLLAHPEVLQEAMEKLQARQEADAAVAARTAIVQSRAALLRDARDPVAGAPKGPVTLVEFFDYRCPYCKASAPQLPALLQRHPNVRFVYKEFPILSEESDKAARAALAAARQGKYAPVHLALMKAAKLDDATIQGVLKAAGVDLARAKADAAGPAVSAQLAETHALARKVGVTGTPAFIVGDRIENGWSPETLDADIAVAAKSGG